MSTSRDPNYFQLVEINWSPSGLRCEIVFETAWEGPSYSLRHFVRDIVRKNLPELYSFRVEHIYRAVEGPTRVIMAQF